MLKLLKKCYVIGSVALTTYLLSYAALVQAKFGRKGIKDLFDGDISNNEFKQKYWGNEE